MKKIILYIALFYGIYHFFISIDTDKLGTRDLTKDIQNSKVSITYILFDKWSEFKLENRNTIRVLSTANLKDDLKEPFIYSIKYQIIDSDGNILKASTYHQFSQVKSYLKGEKKLNRTFYIESKLTPAISKEFFINLEEFPQANRIRFKLEEKDERVFDVAIRTYQKEITPDKKLEYLWQRLKPKTKEVLSFGNLYSYQFLTEDEKRNILKYQYRPFGPLGIEGRDYLVRKMYILKEIDESFKVDESFEYSYDFVKSSKKRTLELNSSSQIKIDMRPKGELNILYFDENHSLNFELNDSAILDLNAGFLEFEPKENMLIDIYSKDKKLEFSKLIKSVYRVDKNSSLDFKIDYYKDEPTALKIDFNLIDSNSCKSQIILNDGDRERFFDLNIESNSSKYITKLSEDLNISQTKSYYFRLKKYKNLSIEADCQTFISLYNRPFKFLKRVTEDYSIDWFKLKSKNSNFEEYLFLAKNFHKDDINISYRKLELKTPTNFIFYRYTKDKELNNFYYEVPLNRALKTKIDKNLEFIYYNRAKNAKVKIYLNNRVIFNSKIRQRRGVFKFNIKNREAKLKIVAKNIDIFTNAKLDTQKYIKQLYNRLDNKITINFKKQKGVERVYFKVFQDFNKTAKLTIDIEPLEFKNELSDGFTFVKKEYLLEPNIEDFARVIYRDIKLDSSKFIALKLDSDLENRDYKITLKSDNPIYFIALEESNETKERIKSSKGVIFEDF